jgi:pimeloyl-ACP methyl ester carboxylesterase
MATQTVVDRFATVNGLRLHYLDWGEETAPPIIALHGLRSFGHNWDAVAREFADRYRVIALDQRGRGESDWHPDAAYYTDAYVSDLEELVGQLGLERFILMGHSMGGSNTIVYASRHPDQVRAAIVEDMGPAGATPAAAGARIGAELGRTPDHFASWAEARAFLRAERPHIGDEALELRLANTLKEVPDGRVTWKSDFAGIRRSFGNADPSRRIDLWPHVRNLQCPTLVLRGAKSDALSAETAAAMAEANPKVRWVEVPDASHYVHDDNTEFFNREVARFLAEVS